MSVTKVTGMMQTGTKGGDIPSASTLVIDTDGDFFDISGTTGITAMTVDAGRRFTLQFDGALTLTHGSSLYLPGATNFTTEANDCLSFIATAANTVRCTGYALKDGGSPVSAGGFTMASEQATTSGTGVTFGSIPAGTKQIIVMFEGVVSGSADAIGVQIGDSGGIETSGYTSTGMHFDDNSNIVAAYSSTAAFYCSVQAGADILSGQIILTLFDAGTFTWVSSYTMGISGADNDRASMGGGHKSLSAELTQLQVYAVGTTFSAGAVNIMYQ